MRLGSEDEARQLILSILPELDIRQKCLTVFAEAIEEANRHGRDLWAVRYRRAGKVRLHVGRVIICTLGRGRIWMALDKGLLETENRQSLLERSGDWEWDIEVYPEYPSISSRNGFYLPSEKHAEVWPVIRPLHFESIYKAANQTTMDPRTFQGHSPELLSYIRKELGRQLPDRLYEPHGGKEARSWSVEGILERLENERGRDSVRIVKWFEQRLTERSDKRAHIRWKGSSLRIDEHATLWPWVVHEEVFYYPPACFRVDGEVEVPLRYMKRLPGRWNEEVLREAPERTPFNDQEVRRKLLDRINEIPGVSLPDTVEGRPTFKLQLLNDEDALDKLVEVFDWYIGEIVDEERGETETGPLLNLYEGYSREEVHDIFSPDTPFTPQSGTWGLHGIVAIPDRPGDFVFFVTLGQHQGDHVFDEGITEDGVLSWQSQPRQGLDSPQILEFIEHDELKNSIYLFFRTGSGAKYTYLGRLKRLV